MRLQTGFDDWFQSMASRRDYAPGGALLQE
jgi:hypothetical protein